MPPVAIPHRQRPVWPAVSPGRFAELIDRSEDKPAACRIAILGLPDDLGVRLNSGRPGAAAAPAAIRAALARFGAAWDAAAHSNLGVLRIWDAGDVQPAEGDDAAALAATHQRVTDATESLHRAGVELVICLGGGHDLTFASVRGLARAAGAPLGGVNVDAHLDVRETPGSGMPFRSLIQEGHLEPARFSVLGAGRFANTREHARWLERAAGRVVVQDHIDHPARLAAELLDRAAGPGPAPRTFLSFDMDVIDAAHAPGVSALNPDGMTPRQAALICDEAGRDPRVRHFDLMELCPAHDEQGRTARLAAFLLLTFLSGVARRQERP